MALSRLAGLSLALLGIAADAADPRITVTTDSGFIAGAINTSLYETPCDFAPFLPVIHIQRTDNVAEFLGVPYAAPPVGPNRFRPPQPPKNWSGVFEAKKVGAQCAQLPANSLVAFPDWIHSTKEDCLYLNIWAPVSSDGILSGKRPVVVFFHGGGFVGGSGMQELNCAIYNGQGLASDIDAVVVNVNYRLGIFGWLADPALLAESGTTGNYGLQDQRAALEWVKRNAVAFGGDPDSITIMGQSAGATSVLHHSVLPRSRGLASRGISMSGYTLSWSLDEAYGRGAQMLSSLGCAGQSDRISCLRGSSTTQLLKGEHHALFGGGTNVVQRLMFFGPVSDGYELPTNTSFMDVLRDDDKQRMPLLVGSTINETNLLQCPSLSPHMPQPDAIEYLLNVLRGARPSTKVSKEVMADVLGKYAGFPDERGAIMALSTDIIFTCAAERISRWTADAGAPVYRYLLASAPRVVRAYPCLGVPHVSDMLLLFHKSFPKQMDIGVVGDAGMQAMVKYMTHAWGRFIHGESPGWSSWKSNDPEATLFSLGDKKTAPFGEVRGYHREICKSIEGIIDPEMLDPVLMV